MNEVGVWGGGGLVACGYQPFCGPADECGCTELGTGGTGISPKLQNLGKGVVGSVWDWFITKERLCPSSGLRQVWAQPRCHFRHV
jgi:hypothetical protein